MTFLLSTIPLGEERLANWALGTVCLLSTDSLMSQGIGLLNFHKFIENKRFHNYYRSNAAIL